MDNLLRKINQEYAIRATSLKPYNSIWKVFSPQGCFTLKRIRSNPDLFAKLAEIINQFPRLEFSAPVPVILSKTGLPYMQNDGLFYSLSPWYEGEPPSFANTSHLQIIAKCFGRLHALSRSINFPPELKSRDCLAEYESSLDFLESLLPGIQKQKERNRIDRAILKWGYHFIDQGRLSVQGLKSLPDRWEALDNCRGFCHNDPAPGNIIIRNENCFLIDFEFSKYDLFIKELSLLILRTLQANHWRERLIELLITAYSRERQLAAEEYEILPYLLCFPRRFWRLCSQRYQEKLDWTEHRFQKRLWEIIDEEKNRLPLLKTLVPELKNFPSIKNL